MVKAHWKHPKAGDDYAGRFRGKGLLLSLTGPCMPTHSVPLSHYILNILYSSFHLSINYPHITSICTLPSRNLPPSKAGEEMGAPQCQTAISLSEDGSGI